MRSHVLKGAFASAVVVAGLLLAPSASKASVIDGFYLRLQVTGNPYDISNIVEFTAGGELTATGQFSILAGTSSINNGFQFKGPSPDYGVFLMGIVHSGDAHDGGLAIFTNTSFSGTGLSFDDLFANYSTEAQLADDLVNATDANGGYTRLANFGLDLADNSTYALTPGSAFTITAFSDGEAIGAGTSSAVTPLPAALPLFAGGLGVVGLLARRRKRRIAAG